MGDWGRWAECERQLLLRADRPMVHPARMVGPLGNSTPREAAARGRCVETACRATER